MDFNFILDFNHIIINLQSNKWRAASIKIYSNTSSLTVCMKSVGNVLKSKSKINKSKMGWLTYTAKNVIVKEIWPSLYKEKWLKKKEKNSKKLMKRLRTWKNRFLNLDKISKKQNASITSKMILTYFVRKKRSSFALDASHSILNISKASSS